MEKIFDLDEVSLIIQAEESTLARYRTVISTYAEKFKPYKVSMVVEIGWGVGDHGSGLNTRPEIQTDYSAFIVCKIFNRDGHIVESDDHDIYMDFAWPLSAFVDNHISVYLDIDEDLFDMMESCENYFRHPY